MTVMPRLLRFRSIWKSIVNSLSVKVADGSSMMMISALCESALHTSTICCRAIDSFPTIARSSMSACMLSSSSRASRCSFFQSTVPLPVIGGWPMNMFSETVSVSTSLISWCTTLMPLLSASSGVWKRIDFPFM